MPRHNINSVPIVSTALALLASVALAACSPGELSHAGSLDDYERDLAALESNLGPDPSVCSGYIELCDVTASICPGLDGPHATRCQSLVTRCRANIDQFCAGVVADAGAPAQDSSASTQDSSASTQDSSASTQDSSASAQDSSASTQDSSASTADQGAPAPPPTGPVFHVRQGASGSGDGSDWHNALPALPAKLQRGAHYYIAPGTYPGYTFDDPTAGDAVITIRKATAQEHGTASGWQAAYAQGQARFGPLVFSTGRYLLDGVTQYGIRVVGGFKGLVVKVDASAAYVTLRRLDLDGAFQKSGGKHSAGVCNVMNTHGQHVVIDRCDLHDAADDGIGLYGSDTSVLHSRIHRLHGCGTDKGCGPCYNGHSDGIEMNNTRDVTIVGSLVYDIQSTSAIFTGNWAAGQFTENLTMLNNIFYTPDTGITVYLQYIKGARIFNNVIWGKTQGKRYGGLAIGKQVTDLELKNNIILNINYNHLGSKHDPAQHHLDYNLFAMIDGGEYSPAPNDQIGDPHFANIVVSGDASQHPSDIAPQDFALGATSPAIDSALDASSLMVDDLLGTKRPRDGDGDGKARWDRGALER